MLEEKPIVGMSVSGFPSQAFTNNDLSADVNKEIYFRMPRDGETSCEAGAKTKAYCLLTLGQAVP